MKNTKNDVKKRIKRIKVSSNDINIDIKIQDLLMINRFIRKRALIEQLMKKTGLSQVTIIRKLDYLISNKEIAIIGYDSLRKYGIEDTDKRAVYLASKETLALNTHIEAVFELFNTNDVNSALIGIRELKNYEAQYYGRYFLDKSQVDKLVKVLEKTISNKTFKDDTLRYDLLGIIFNELTRHFVIPSNKQTFVEILKELLKQYPSSEYYNKSNNPIPYITHILGIYMDHVVIDRLKYDTEACDPQILRNIEIFYSNWYPAKLIDDNKIELMKFEVELQKKKKSEAIEFIERLRRGAGLHMKDMQGTQFYDLYEKVQKANK
jgi:hypothetical protein